MGECLSCRYYCVHTGSCDYLLQTGLRRGCPKSQCLRYEKLGGEQGRGGSAAYTRLEERFLLLYSEGLNDREIARRLNVSRQSVCTWRVRLDFPSCRYREAQGHGAVFPS